MHLQIKGSPDSVDVNMRRIVDVLAQHGINIEAIAPDFDAPHVRVLVEHAEPYDPADANDTFNKALAALEADGIGPEAKAAVTLRMPNKPRVLQAAMDRVTRAGHRIESVLVLPAGANGVAMVSLGVARGGVDGWGPAAHALQAQIEAELQALPNA
jgi:hypothetical protein